MANNSVMVDIEKEVFFRKLLFEKARHRSVKDCFGGVVVGIIT